MQVHLSGDTVTIEGGQTIQGGHVDSRGDHRIAMAFLMSAFHSNGEITVHDCRNIETSFPNFIETVMCLGLEIQ